MQNSLTGGADDKSSQAILGTVTALRPPFYHPNGNLLELLSLQQHNSGMAQTSTTKTPPAEVEEDELDFEARKERVQQEEERDIEIIEEEWGSCTCFSSKCPVSDHIDLKEIS